MAIPTETTVINPWRVNNGFIYDQDCKGLEQIINQVPEHIRIFNCRFWWCPMNQCLLRLAMEPDFPLQGIGYSIIQNINYIIERMQKKSIPTTKLAQLFPIVITDDKHYTITVFIADGGTSSTVNVFDHTTGATTTTTHPVRD